MRDIVFILSTFKCVTTPVWFSNRFHVVVITFGYCHLNKMMSNIFEAFTYIITVTAVSTLIFFTICTTQHHIKRKLRKNNLLLSDSNSMCTKCYSHTIQFHKPTSISYFDESGFSAGCWCGKRSALCNAWW